MTTYLITVGSGGESEPACRDRRGRSPDPSRPQGDARGRGLLGRGRSRRRGVRRRASDRAAPGSGHPGRQDADPGRHLRRRADRRGPARAGRHPHRLLPARARGTSPRRRRDGLPGQAVHQGRPGARGRDGGQPVHRDPRARPGDRHAARAAGGPQAARPGQGPAPVGARAQRARGVPLDPEDVHGPSADDAQGRRGRYRRQHAGPRRASRLLNRAKTAQKRRKTSAKRRKKVQRSPGGRWCRACLPPADTFSTWTPGPAVTTLATGHRTCKREAAPPETRDYAPVTYRLSSSPRAVQVGALRLVPDQAGQPGRAHAVAARIRDHDVIGGQRPAPVREGGHRRDLAVADAPVVRRADLDADHHPARARVQERAERSDGLREHAGRAAVQQAVRLGVALDRHGGDDPRRRRGHDRDAHPARERALGHRPRHNRVQHLLIHAYLPLTRPEYSVPCGHPGSVACRPDNQPAPSATRGTQVADGATTARSANRIEYVATQAPDSAAQDRLLLLDGHSLAYRAFFALPIENFSTTTGQPTNAVYGFTAMLINVLRDEKPTHVAVAFDRGEPTFRHEQWVEYKANRRETPEDFRSQLSLIFEVLDALGIRRLSAPGYEADDLIATLATEAAAENMDVLIVTGDRDVLQLVSDRVTVLMTRRGITEMTRFTPDTVQEKYGLSPAQYPDFAAVRGDPSDNLPGIPGVGEKTATKWIAEFGSLANLVDRVDEVKGKAGDALREHLANVLRNRQLTSLVTDLPAETVGAVPGDLLPAAWLASHSSAERSGLAVAGTWGCGTGQLTAVAIAAPDGHGAHLDPTALTQDDDRALAAWLADPAHPKVLHDAKGPLHAFAAHGFTLAGLECDTALAAYLALPGQRTFDLADLTLRYTGQELPEDSKDGQLTLDGSVERDAAAGLVLRAQATLQLAAALDADLDRREAGALLRELELPLVSVLAKMERTGIAADLDHFAAMSATLHGEVKTAEQASYAVVGHEFNLGSPKQLQEILFNERSLPKTRRIKTGYTTDSEALISLLAQTEHPVLEHLLRHRDVSKLMTIVDSLIPMPDEGGRIHTTFNQTIAATGRLSSTDPNLQNIPIRTELGRRIREGFIVGPGYECLLTADYSQIELRIMAHLSGDEALIAAFESGHDFHAATASRVFGLPPEEVGPELRAKIKAMNYGLAYGLSAFGLSQQLRISTDEARVLMEDYFKEFGGVRDYLHEVVGRARMDGYTATMMGRRRYLPDLTSDNRQRREMAERMALNAPIQGSAADVIKVAMLAVDSSLAAAGLRSRMLLQVHDELIIEVAPGEFDAARELVCAAMAGAASLRVPLDVSVGTGRSWAEAAH